MMIERRFKDLLFILALSKNAFIRYLMSVDNSVIDRSKFEVFMEMDRPLPEYFIASSHNTYLIG